MGKGRMYFRRLVDQADGAAGALPGHPILELAGDRRVLIENHLGVTEYGPGRITVAMAYGCVSVVGQRLEILRMTKEQLVICGIIGGIEVKGRDRH